ncbi:MAG: c-type cytochrome [Bdellovibrionales bacterium]|nr:c-type cytochrome [Bdellovibrionales bacterium]
MNNRRSFSAIVLQLALASALSLNPGNDALAADPQYLELFAPLPPVAPSLLEPDGQKLVALGQRLYFEKKLSLAGDLSCNSCHKLSGYGVDNEPTSPGHLGQRGDRNSPTVYNAFLHISQFWDGRAKDVEEQALGPILNPVEMAMPNEDEVVKRLAEDASYRRAFQEAFPQSDPAITYTNIGTAIGAFERTLVTPSRFDEFLRGNREALSVQEQRGLRQFVEVGCASCHGGVGLGGGMFQKLGLVHPFLTSDIGRAKVTSNSAEAYFFKVPSLRNIEKTGPYFHDGSVASLQEAIRLMGYHQLGKELSKEQISSIETFLRATTGALPDVVSPIEETR